MADKDLQSLAQYEIIVDFPFSNDNNISLNFGMSGEISSILFLLTSKTTTEILNDFKFCWLSNFLSTVRIISKLFLTATLNSFPFFKLFHPISETEYTSYSYSNFFNLTGRH
ncbi:MAG: hypothetical protein JNJ56_03775 [Ignavibacteria bacterium]|nr:hypothetical protein [Ignavibacteria bacterium]